jgi:hypothetical protein
MIPVGYNASSKICLMRWTVATAGTEWRVLAAGVGQLF